VHKIAELYKKIYKISQKVSKRDKFGICLKIENLCLETLSFAIKAAFTAKIDKAKFISQMRVVTEVLKNLVRVAYELNILDKNVYLNIQLDLQEISKMGAGWLKYAQ
jgi:hypothetical protein